ncbi:MAG: DUF3667 domain-containing protein [Salinibacter sp.]|uniref:DUF3667 domain-containing protein n=1 Tax=Salinibacter sp. TaxID=2065818 RepID=UPI0035D45B6E
MSAPPPGSGPDDPEKSGDGDLSGRAASDPDEARAAAEDALAQVEALADLDEEVESGSGATGQTATSASSARPSSGAGSAAASDEGTLEDQCENCGALLHGPYCSQCGQKAADRIVPIWHMLNEALEAVFELDMRVLHTLPKFLFLPGRLTKEYINGRRKRYIRPFRLYLFSTFLLFTVLTLTTTGGFGLLFPPSSSAPAPPADTATVAPASVVGDAPAAPLAPDSTLAPTEADSVEGTGLAVGRNHGPDEAGDDSSHLSIKELLSSQRRRSVIADSLRKEFSQETADTYLEQTLFQNIPKVVEDPWGFAESTIDRGPYLMFLMLPIFALLMKLLYVRRGRLYAEHLVFSLHVHAFAFFAFATGILLDQLGGAWLSVAGTCAEVAPLLYLILAMSHVYEQGLIKTAFKAVILLFFYVVILAIGAVCLALAVVLMM